VQAHRAVLLAEVLDALAIRPAGTYVDATFGRGGHSTAILDRLDSGGTLYAIDRDPQAIAHGTAQHGDDVRLRLVQASFADLGAALARAGLTRRVDGILLDLGVSSPQLDDPARGFSFLRDGPLDMRMDPQAGESAAAWLAHASEREIADVIFRYGEERRARRVARAIVEARAKAPISRTGELASIVAGALPGPRGGKHPATRVFQALRIHVNRELEALEACLPQCVELLAPGGRLACISFHSLEDRIVKRYLRARSQVDPRLAKLPGVPEDARPVLRVLGRGTRPAAEETERNPRARSAVLRAAERIA
jgi:16S rRNA (cytosine1402-N4)-methyltransferase